MTDKGMEADERPAERRPIRLIIQQPSLRRYRVPVYRELARRDGIDLTVLYGDQAEVGGAEPDGFRGRPVPLSSFRLGGRTLLWHGPQWWAASRRHTDVLLLSWSVNYLSLVPGLIRAKLAGVPTVLWGHGYSKSEHPVRRFIRNLVARLATTLLFYNHTTARQFEREGWNPDRLFVALNALDQDPVQAARADWLSRPDDLRAFQAERGLDRGPVVLFVSRLYEDNRVDLLIDAMAELCEAVPDVRLVVIGSGPAQAALERRACELGVDGRIAMPGAVYGEEQLAPWFLSADVFCYPTNVGLSMLHAFGYGVPVVTSDRTEAQNPEIEALDPGVNGQTYRHGDASDLARVLAEMLNDEAARRKMAEAAHRTATEQFTLENMVDGMVAAVRQAASPRKER